MKVLLLSSKSSALYQRSRHPTTVINKLLNLKDFNGKCTFNLEIAFLCIDRCKVELQNMQLTWTVNNLLCTFWATIALFLTCVEPLSHTGCIEWIDPRCNIVSFHQFQSTILRWELSKTHGAFDFECNWSWGRVDHFQVAHTAVGHQWHLKKKKKSVLWKETFMFPRIPWQDGSPH